MLKALKRLEDVQEMFERRHVSLKRLSAKQTRPVQHVAPRPESSPKQASAKSSQRTAGSQQRERQRVPDPSNSNKQPAEVDPSKKKSARKAKAGIKVEYCPQHTETEERPSGERSQVQRRCVKPLQTMCRVERETLFD